MSSNNQAQGAKHPEGLELTIDEIKSKYTEYAKLYQRVLRNGENVAGKVGRKPVSEEHKKKVYKDWLEARKVKRAEQAIAEGREYKRGRPKKIPTMQTIEV